MATTDAPAHVRADPERVGRRDHVVGAAASASVIAIWAVLAVWRPTVTYHLAPLVAGAAWPVALRRGAALRVARRDGAIGALAGGAIAVLVASMLWQFDLLRGPTLWGAGAAIGEVIPAALLGAVGGYRYARCGQSG